MIQSAAACSSTQPKITQPQVKKPRFNWQALFMLCGKKLSMDHMTLYK